MPVVWSKESYMKLLAAVIAVHDLSPNYGEIAALFGENTTYNSMQFTFRAIRKQAKELREGIDSGKRPAAAPLTPRKRKAATVALPGSSDRKGKSNDSVKSQQSKKKRAAGHEEASGHVKEEEDAPEGSWSAADDDSD